MDNFSAEMIYYNHRRPTPGWEVAEHVSHCTNLTYILDGEAVYYIDDTAYSVRAGDLLYTAPGARIRAHSFPDKLVEAQCMSFHIHSSDGTPFKIPFTPVNHIGSHPELKTFYSEIQKNWLLRESGYKLRIQAYLLLILDRFFQLLIYPENHHVNDHRIRQAMEYVLNNYSKPLTLSDVAQIVDLSPMYFGNLFKQQTNVSFRQYVTSIRLNQAENMLLSGEYRVGEVAELCGFSDAFYFSKVYREQKGISPSKVFQSGQSL